MLDDLLTYAQPVDGIMASILSTEAYDVTYGINTHDKDWEPLSLITMHPKENVILHGKMQTTIRAFRTHKVGTHMNMSLTEFLELPRYVTRMILKDCEEAEKAEAQKAASIMNGLNSPKGK